MKRERSSRRRADSSDGVSAEPAPQAVADRRKLRSQYLAVKTLINDKRDDLSQVDLVKFRSIMSEVENLHERVQKPREQVADAEALLDIANTLVTSVRSQSSEGFTPSDFVTALLREFRQHYGGGSTMKDNQDSIHWKDVGLAVSRIFRKAQGCCTMLGPMNTELKQRKTLVYRKRARPTKSARPEELDKAGEEERTDTDKNMSTMFEILKKKKCVELESLMLNRKSFAQTVENLFALSFLVKDGRAEITVDENGSHLVSPKNAPAASSVMSGEVVYSHFVFRFDFKDWKLMMDLVPLGEELMPHREQLNVLAGSQAGPVSVVSQAASRTTPIKKLSRNRGLVIQEQSIVEDCPEIDDTAAARATAIKKYKRKLKEYVY